VGYLARITRAPRRKERAKLAGSNCPKRIPRRFTVLTRASGSMGKVTMEISQKSILSRPLDRLVATC